MSLPYDSKRDNIYNLLRVTSTNYINQSLPVISKSVVLVRRVSKRSRHFTIVSPEDPHRFLGKRGKYRSMIFL